MEASLKVTFDLFDEVLKEIRDRRRKLKDLRLEIHIFEGRDAVGWMIKVEKYFNAGGICKEEDQIPRVAQLVSGKVVTCRESAMEMREMRFSDEPNKWPPPQWFCQQPLLPKPQNVGYHMVIVVVPKINSRKEKVQLSVVIPTINHEKIDGSEQI
ncbi:unnamed protein product [Vicia faba]|uniref:Uncharacterized protein n=1 Tax=Vicia faba TaxID=3906 RepID=A0AAV1A9N0_VICFA|nr:unnamed protein product [Vicia faba]